MSYRVCPACGSLVADVDVHVVWHGPTDLPPGQEARLRFGHPRDWPKTPGAPDIAPQTEPPLEPPRSVREVVTDPPPETPPADPTPEP